MHPTSSSLARNSCLSRPTKGSLARRAASYPRMVRSRMRCSGRSKLVKRQTVSSRQLAVASYVKQSMTNAHPAMSISSPGQGAVYETVLARSFRPVRSRHGTGPPHMPKKARKASDFIIRWATERPDELLPVKAVMEHIGETNKANFNRDVRKRIAFLVALSNEGVSVVFRGRACVGFRRDSDPSEAEEAEDAAEIFRATG